jgi:hypothetical protein
MSKLSKLVVLLLCISAVSAVTVSPVTAAPSSCRASQIAEANPCVQAQLDIYRSTSLYRETRVEDQTGDGAVTLTYVFTPKCLNGPIPCRLVTQTVVVLVDCTADAAICM